MNSADFEKLAGRLAEIATSADFEKTAGGISDFLGSDAGRYLIGGLGGAGAGAILGATQPDKEKRKRNMLYYGALGGLGGLGVAHLTNSLASPLASPPATPPPPIGSPAAEREQAYAAQNASDADFLKNLEVNIPGHAASTAAGVTGAAAAGAVGIPLSRMAAGQAVSGVPALERRQGLATEELRRRQAEISNTTQTANRDALQLIKDRDLQTRGAAQASDLVTRQNMTAAYTQLQHQRLRAQTTAMNDMIDANNRAGPFLQGTDNITKLKAQHAAANLLNKQNYDAYILHMTNAHARGDTDLGARQSAAQRALGNQHIVGQRAMAARHTAEQVADAARFVRGMRMRGHGFSALGNVLKFGLPVGGFVAGKTLLPHTTLDSDGKPSAQQSTLQMLQSLFGG